MNTWKTRLRTFYSYLSALYLILFISCAKIETLGLQEHQFNAKLSRIVWLQVPGLLEEHLAMIRFHHSLEGGRTSIENSTCLGKIWNYNNSELRPSAEKGFMSQLIGTKNVQDICQNFDRGVLWNIIPGKNVRTVVLERATAENESLAASLNCENGAKLSKNTTFLTMGKAPKEGANFFHFQEPLKFEGGKRYYDKSCQKGNCYSGPLVNSKALWPGTNKNFDFLLIIIRDFSFINALNAKKITDAREILMEIERTYRYFSAQAGERDDTLLLLSTSSGRNLELPLSGKEWQDFERLGKNVIFKRASLMSPVFALGAHSENFCGIYEEHDIFKRILWSTEEKKFFFRNFSF